MGTFSFQSQIIVTTAGSGGSCSQGQIGLQLEWTDADTNVPTTGLNNVTFQSGTTASATTIGNADVSRTLGTMYYSIPLPIHAAAGTFIAYQAYQVVASNCATPPVITIRPALRYMGYECVADAGAVSQLMRLRQFHILVYSTVDHVLHRLLRGYPTRACNRARLQSCR